MACAAKDVSGVRGTDVFVTAGRIVEMQSLKIGWRVGAMADAVCAQGFARPVFLVFLYLYHHHPSNATAKGGRACSNTTNKACWLNKQKGLRFFRMNLMDAAARNKGVMRSIISLPLPSTGGDGSYGLFVAPSSHHSRPSRKSWPMEPKGYHLCYTSMYLQLPSC